MARKRLPIPSTPRAEETRHGPLSNLLKEFPVLRVEEWLAGPNSVQDNLCRIRSAGLRNLRFRCLLPHHSRSGVRGAANSALVLLEQQLNSKQRASGTSPSQKLCKTVMDLAR